MRVGATSWRKSNHPTKRFGQLPKRSKPRDIPLYPTQKPDNSEAIDDAEIVSADSIETHCLTARTTSLISVASRKRFSKNFLEPRSGTPRLTQRSPNASEIIYYHLSPLKARGNHAEKGSSDEQFGFLPSPFCPQQVLRLVVCLEGFETERSTVAVSLMHERTPHSTRRLIEQSLKAPPLSAVPAYTNDVPRPSSSGVQLLFADDTARALYGNRNRSTRFLLPPEGH
ncbi:hypothetical protein EVAR_56528_1 [Eumeta japonica]|uniref:Uncharacterized protein n=1 Tax=Eumeta variegata TaxID=151549 RepID=A0A4C1ZY82_EUMVA|nr:hypothetical protein EVAR_56528_1 [Eumeta japonica]